jgi:hypothetical protein
MELPTLRDGDLILRPKVPADADALTATVQDREIPRWTLVPSPYTRADAEEYIARSAEAAAAGSSANLLAVDANDGRLLTDWARHTLGLTRLEVLPHQDNAVSRRVAEKAGYRDTRELTVLERAESDEPVFAVYVYDG